MSNLELLFTINLQKGDQHTGVERIIHGAKYHKHNELQNLESAVHFHISEY